MIVLESDQELEPKTAYQCYEDRWLLELVFNRYKSDECLDHTDVQNDFSVIGSEFINFLSTVATCRIIRRAQSAGLFENMSYGELMDDLSSAWRKTDAPEDPATDDGYWVHTLKIVFDELEALGAKAEQAQSGAEAIDMITRRHESGHDYNIVILDWKMPDMDGTETIRRIRTEVDPEIPILLVSAYDWSEIEDVARDAGANGFVSKPIFRSTFYNKINELLGTESKSAEPEDDFSDLNGMNILVAEDIDVNWEIISCMLTMVGITSERAENGRICVEKMRTAPEGSYDLIFMDVQMPEMNGLDATRAIRKLGDAWASSIPMFTVLLSVKHLRMPAFG